MPIKPTYHYSLSDVDVDVGRVSLLSRCRILASAELSGCIWQHQWQAMPRSRCQNSAAVWGDADWLIQDGGLVRKFVIFLSFNIYRSTQLNENVTTFCFTAYTLPFTCRKWTKSAFAFRSSETFHGDVWYCSCTGWMWFKSPKQSYVWGNCTAAVNTPYTVTQDLSALYNF